MSSEAMRAVFDNLTSGFGRRAEQGYNTDSAAHHEADSIEGNVKSARLSIQMHVTDWAEAHMRTQRSKLPWTGVASTRRN